MLQSSFNHLPFVLEPLSPSNITWSVCGPAKLQRSSLCPGRGAGWTEEARVGGLSAQIHLIPASRSPTPASTRPLVFSLDPRKPPALLVCLPAGAFFIFSFAHGQEWRMFLSTMSSARPSLRLFCRVHVGSWLLSGLHSCLNTFEIPSTASLQPLTQFSHHFDSLSCFGDLADSQADNDTQPLPGLNVAEGSDVNQAEQEFILAL